MCRDGPQRGPGNMRCEAEIQGLLRSLSRHEVMQGGRVTPDSRYQSHPLDLNLSACCAYPNPQFCSATLDLP